MGAAEEAAISIRPGEGAVYHRAVADAITVLYEVPTAWKGHRVMFAATGAGYQIQFGDNANITAVKDQDSDLSTATLTAHDDTSWPIAVGEKEVFNVNTSDTHFSIVGEGTGEWFARVVGPSGG